MQKHVHTKYVPAIDFGDIILVSSTFSAQIWITFTHSQKAGTLLGVALSFTAASWKPILTVRAALTKLFTKV